MVGLMATFRRNYAKGDLPGPLLPVPPSLWAGPVNSCLHRRPSNPSREFWFSLLGGHCSSALGLGACTILCVSTKTGVSVFLQSYGSPIIKSCWTAQTIPWGFSVSVGSPGWEIWCGIQNLHNSGRTSLVLLFSSLWVTHPAGMGFDFYCDCAPPTNFLRLFCLWIWGIFFLVGSSILLSMVVQHLVAILVLLQKMSQSPEFFFNQVSFRRHD